MNESKINFAQAIPFSSERDRKPENKLRFTARKNYESAKRFSHKPNGRIFQG